MKSPISKVLLGAALLAGACVTLPASAQEVYAPSESVIVTAPRFHVEGGTRVNTLPESFSLSTQVRYDDLDLRSDRDAHILHLRVRDAARDVCAQVADAFPVHQLAGTSCYRTALRDGLVRADEAITDARMPDYYR